MNPRKKNIILSVFVLGIGLLTLMLFAFEIRDGMLQGSRSSGITQANNPIGFYISTGLEGLIGSGLVICGAYFFRKKD